MRLPRFTILQMMLGMLIVCVAAAAMGYAVSGPSESSPLVFILMVVSAPALLLVVVRIVYELTRRR